MKLTVTNGTLAGADEFPQDEPQIAQSQLSINFADETTLLETQLVVVIDQYLLSLRPECPSSKGINKNMSPTYCQTVHIFVTYLEQNTRNPFANKRVFQAALPPSPLGLMTLYLGLMTVPSLGLPRS